MLTHFFAKFKIVMSNLIYLFVFPLIILSQNSIDSLSMGKSLKYSYDIGAKIYSGNLFLDQQEFSREGIYFNFNIFSEKVITKKTNLIIKSSLNLNNAFLKKLHISIESDDVEINSYNTRVPNILSCDINFALGLKKKISNLLSHSLYLKFRAWPLFYKKGQVLGGELNSFGGFISSEENGSFPGLEKTTKIAYSINYLLNQMSSIKLFFFLNSDFGFNNINNKDIFPGLGLQFDKSFNFNRK